MRKITGNQIAPIRTLFVTYCTLQKDPRKSSLIGVLKRCVRLVANCPSGAIEPHLLNFGDLPPDDPLLREWLPRMTVHLLRDAVADLPGLLDRVRPEVIVLGEGPSGGEMLRCSRIAAERGIPQLCIENYYSPDQPAHFVRENPLIAQWFLLGLPFAHRYGRISSRAVLAPPLLPIEKSDGADPTDLTILGYDFKVAELGLRLLQRLPKTTRARLIYSRHTWEERAKLKPLIGDRPLVFIGLPTDGRLSAYVASSRLVVCKSGFQQMMESLALGTPVIAYDGPGAVPAAFVDRRLAPFIHYFPSPLLDWQRTVLQAAVWVSQQPVIPWRHEIASMEEPARQAAATLVMQLGELAGRSSEFLPGHG